MKFLKYFFLLLLIGIITLAVYAAVQPNDFKFNRSKIINAPASVLYNKVNDYKEWPSFSPWTEMEPEASISYSDNTFGKNASYSWSGEILGEGTMTTKDTETNKSINQKLEFIKPYEALSNINWHFETTETGTKVIWEMEGQNSFIGKFIGIFNGGIEPNIAPSFERGLFKLDSIVQVEMKAYTIDVKDITQHSGGYYLYNTTSCKFSDYEQKMKAMLPKVGAYAITHNVTMAGPPFILYHKWDKENDAVIFSCCVPTTSKIVSEQSDILTGQLKSFKAVKTVLKGNYENLKEAWEKTKAYIAKNNMEMIDGGSMLETYLTDPISKPNPADWVTEIYIAVK